MANSIANSRILQVHSLGVGVGLGTSLGLHDTRPQSLSENSIQLDPLSLRITLVIVFVIIFLFVVLVIFLVVCLKRHGCIGRSKSENCEANGSDRLRSNRTRFNTAENDGSLPRPRTLSNESANSFMNDNEDYLHGINYISSAIELEKVSKKSYEPRSQQPDIIEAEIHFVPSYHTYDYAYDHRIYGPSNEQTKVQVQCEKLNAPDVNFYRTPQEPLRHSPVSYREHQDAQEAKQRNFVQHSLVLRSHFNSPPSSSVPPTNNVGLGMAIHGNANGKGDHFLNSPLTRLTPSTSSESPQHSVRILTLQDISRKQLQSVGLLLESTSSSGGVSKDIVNSNSAITSWNSPVVSQFSKWSSIPEASMESSGAKQSPLDVLHSDNLQNVGVPSLEFQPDDCSTTTESDDDDSFTGSEFCDDEINSGAVAKTTNQTETHIDLIHTIEPVDTTSNNEEFDVGLFPDAFSMLVSGDNCPGTSNKSGTPSLDSLEYLLNWGLNFESLVDVFQDLAELPDLEPERPGNNQSASSPCEIYV